MAEARVVCRGLPPVPSLENKFKPKDRIESLDHVIKWSWTEWKEAFYRLPGFDTRYKRVRAGTPVPVNLEVYIDALSRAGRLLASRIDDPTLTRRLFRFSRETIPKSNTLRDTSKSKVPMQRVDVVDGTAYMIKTRAKFDHILCIGDIHSSLHSMAEIVSMMIERKKIDERNMKISNDSALVFLGDMVNRGPYSIMVILFMCVLIILNPKRVFVVSGNHEDPGFWNSPTMQMSLSQEIDYVSRVLHVDPTVREKAVHSTNRFFILLPVAIFFRSPISRASKTDKRAQKEKDTKCGLGRRAPWLQINHGGIDPVLAGASYRSITKRKIQILWENRGGKNVVKKFLSPKFPYSTLELTIANSTMLSDDLDVVHDKGKADIASSMDYHLMKWGDFNGNSRDMINDPSTGRWFVGRPTVATYLERTGVGMIVGGHQDLTKVGVFSSNSRSLKRKGVDGVYDFDVPSCKMSSKGKDGECHVSDFMVLKTSASSQSKPTHFDGLCYIDVSHATSSNEHNEEFSRLM